MINQIQNFTTISLPYSFTDKITQFKYLTFCKYRSFRSIQIIACIIYRIIVLSDIIMQIGTRSKMYILILYSCIIVFDQLGIGPCLIGWVNNLSHCTTGIGFHKRFRFIDCLQFFPLFQFNDHHTRMMFFVISGNHEIHAFGRLGNIVFDGDTALIRNFPVL